jgi:hypothetical protein
MPTNNNSTTELMATKVLNFVDECNKSSLLDIYRSIFGEDDLTERLRKEIDQGVEENL